MSVFWWWSGKAVFAVNEGNQLYCGLALCPLHLTAYNK